MAYTLKTRDIPYDDSWDVIVIGGGPAGCTAAASAAREGAKTLLVEATGCLGGMGTSGLVPAWCPFSDKEKIIYRGLAERVFQAVKDGMPHIDRDALDWVAIDPELLKSVYDDLVTDYNVTVLFNTFFSSVDTNENGSVKAVIFSNKSGLSAYGAKVYIDCTGDGDLAAWSGAEFIKGDDDEEDLLQANLQPATHCFILTNVNEESYLNGPELHPNNKKSPIYDIISSGDYPLIPDTHLCNTLIGPSTVGFNAGHLWDVDNTNPGSVSEALMIGRKMAAAFRDALAEYQPEAFVNAFLVSTGSLMGIRETRRIIGDYVLTLQDYLERRSFSDEICRNSYYIDIHQSKEELELVLQGKFNADDRCAHYGKGESHGIPYRCLTPKGLKNVLVAGRSISCDRAVQGSVRVMPVCLAMGEAAGMAAAFAVNIPDYDVHKVDTSKLRERLREEGGHLP